MLRRLTLQPAARAAPCVAPAMRAARARVSACPSMTDPIGQGKVMPLKFDYLRPAYLCPTNAQYMAVIFAYFQTIAVPGYMVGFVIVWGLHGGFSGHLPPDPHDLHK